MHLLRRIIGIVAVLALAVSLLGMPLTASASRHPACASPCSNCLDMAAAPCNACGTCVNAIRAVDDDEPLQFLTDLSPVANEDDVESIKTRPPVPPPRA
jgi:hypothetical protein